MSKKNMIGFIKPYRVLKLTKKQIKNITTLKAIDFANKVERKIYHYFNIASWYYLSDKKIFPTKEILEKFIDKNPVYKENKIKQKYVLFMQQ